MGKLEFPIFLVCVKYTIGIIGEERIGGNRCMDRCCKVKVPALILMVEVVALILTVEVAADLWWVVAAVGLFAGFFYVDDI